MRCFHQATTEIRGGIYVRPNGPIRQPARAEGVLAEGPGNHDTTKAKVQRTDPSNSIPHVLFVDCDPMFVAQLPKFVLEGAAAMMFFLTPNILDDFFEI